MAPQVNTKAWCDLVTRCKLLDEEKRDCSNLCGADSQKSTKWSLPMVVTCRKSGSTLQEHGQPTDKEFVMETAMVQSLECVWCLQLIVIRSVKYIYFLTQLLRVDHLISKGWLRYFAKEISLLLSLITYPEPDVSLKEICQSEVLAIPSCKGETYLFSCASL